MTRSLQRRHTSIALVAAVVIHLAAAAVVFRQPHQPGAEATGQHGIEVALGPSGASSGSVAGHPVVEETEPIDEVEVLPEEEPAEPEVEVPPLVEEAYDEPAAEVPEELAVEEQPEEQPVEEQPIEEPEVADLVEATDETEIAELPEVVSGPRPIRRPELRPEPEPEPRPTTTEPATELTPEEMPSETPVPAVPGADGKVGVEEEGEGAVQETHSAGGVEGARADYLSQLRAWLERHKEYPNAARLRRNEGTVLLRFVVAPEGKVLSYEIERSSGYVALDRAVAQMIERAQPLPAMPKEMGRQALTLVLPVEFSLR